MVKPMPPKQMPTVQPPMASAQTVNPPAKTPVMGNTVIGPGTTPPGGAASDFTYRATAETGVSPRTNTPPQPLSFQDGVQAPQAPGGDVPVPSTTQNPSALDGPGPLFTAENTDWEGIAGSAPDVTAEQTVQGQLDKLFSDGSPVLDYARGQAQQFSAQRGLLNSNMAAEAGQQAVMAQALPIAQQDANTYAQRAAMEAQFYQTAGLQAQQATIASTLQAQDHLERMTEMVRQGDINSRLQLEQYGYNFELNAQQNIHNMQLAALQGDIQATLALQQFGFNTQLMQQDYGFRMTLQDVELRNALTLNQQQDTLMRGRMSLEDQMMNRRAQQANSLELQRMERENELLAQRISQEHANTLEQIQAQSQARMDEVAQSGDVQLAQDEQRFGRELQQNYLSATERRTLQFSSEVTAIYSQPGLTAAQQANAIQVARRNYEQDLANLVAYYSKSPYWDNSWGAGLPGGGAVQPTQPPIMTPPSMPGAPPAPRPGGDFGGGDINPVSLF